MITLLDGNTLSDAHVSSEIGNWTRTHFVYIESSFEFEIIFKINLIPKCAFMNALTSVKVAWDEEEQLYLHTCNTFLV